jgi:hypothetical protein
MVAMTRFFVCIASLISLTLGYCFATSFNLHFIGGDTKSFMGYSYKIEKKNDHCMNWTEPSSGIITPGTGVTFDLDEKSGAFSYCGWRSSYQWFHIEKYDDPSISADVQWLKKAGKTPHINIEHDTHGIVHKHPGHPIVIGVPRPKTED